MGDVSDPVLIYLCSRQVGHTLHEQEQVERLLARLHHLHG